MAPRQDLYDGPEYCLYRLCLSVPPRGIACHVRECVVFLFCIRFLLLSNADRARQRSFLWLEACLKTKKKMITRPSAVLASSHRSAARLLPC